MVMYIGLIKVILLCTKFKMWGFFHAHLGLLVYINSLILEYLKEDMFALVYVWVLDDGKFQIVFSRYRCLIGWALVSRVADNGP